VASTFGGTSSANEAQEFDKRQFARDVLELVLDSKSFQARSLVAAQNQAFADGYLQEAPYITIGQKNGTSTQFVLYFGFTKAMKGGNKGQFGFVQQRFEITGNLSHKIGADPTSAWVRMVLSVENIIPPKHIHRR